MRFLLLSCFVVCFVSFGFSQRSEPKKTEREITVCQIKLKVGSADFAFNYQFAVTTDNSGAVNEVSKLGKDRPPFVNDDEFIPCIKSWKLGPNEEYFVTIRVATIFKDRNKNFILISSKKETLKLLLD